MFFMNGRRGARLGDPSILSAFVLRDAVRLTPSGSVSRAHRTHGTISRASAGVLDDVMRAMKRCFSVSRAVDLLDRLSRSLIWLQLVRGAPGSRSSNRTEVQRRRPKQADDRNGAARARQGRRPCALCAVRRAREAGYAWHVSPRSKLRRARPQAVRRAVASRCTACAYRARRELHLAERIAGAPRRCRHGSRSHSGHAGYARASAADEDLLRLLAAEPEAR